MQARRRPAYLRRQVRHTVRIVCEGRADESFVKHVRSLYLARQGNVALTTKVAHGKGGRHALTLACSRHVRAGIDTVAILIDTDQDWNDQLRAIARRAGIQVLESQPCLEAWLLRVLGVEVTPRTADCKRIFADRCGGEAHEDGIYQRHFPKPALDSARRDIEVLDRLLTLLGVPKAT